MQSQPVSPPPMTNTSNPCDVIGVEFGVVNRLSPLLPPPPSYHHLITIINTRPKPAYGRQGLAGSWGQDTDEVSTLLVFLASHFAPAALSSDLTNLGPLMTMKIHLETLKNHENPLGTMKKRTWNLEKQ